MARVPITVMGYRCERCGHEWIPRDFENEPKSCPKCNSTLWNKPKTSMMSYQDFSKQVQEVLQKAGQPINLDRSTN